MAQISFSKVLQTKRRWKIVTLVFVLILAVAAAQLLLINNARRSLAIDGCSDDTCYIQNLDHIPASFENQNVVIENGATVYADKVRVWQDTAAGHTKGQECSTDGNMFAYWPMDETGYTEVANKVHPEYSFYDNATIVNGKFGKARLNFYPEGRTIDTAVPVSWEDVSGFKPTTAMGIGAWFNWNGASSSIIMINMGAIDKGYMLWVESNRVNFRVDNQTVQVNSDIAKNQWYWVFAKYQAGGEINLQIKDGAGWERGITQPATAGPINYTGSENPLIAQNTFDGILDDVRFYNKFPNSSDVSNSENGTYQNTNKNNSQCDSIRHFKSLIIRDNAVVTHNRVTALDMAENVTNPAGKSLADETTGTARWKRVDFVVDEEIELYRGGKIDVTAKGYPQAPKVDNVAGYGPGGGMSKQNDNSAFAAGGGYGGMGGSWDEGDGSTSIDGKHCTDANISGLVCGGLKYVDRNVFDFGSGGGSGFGDNKFKAGGHGGGRVRLISATFTISSDSQVIANGGYSTGQDYSSSGNFSAGGAGSGGHIEIVSDSITGTYGAQATKGPIYSEDGPPTFDDSDDTYHLIKGDLITDAEDGIEVIENINYNASISVVPNIQANGGATWVNGVGGGGMVIIQGPPTISLSGVTIKKTLRPISRPYNAAPPNTNFNPYALQVNDQIEVRLEVSGLTPGQLYTIDDEFLSTPGKKCAHDATLSAVPVPSVTTASGVSWSFTPLGPTYTLTYQCKTN